MDSSNHDLEPSSWRKSTYSATGGSCVEVGRLGDGAAVRDTKDRDRGYFTATRAQWGAFIRAIADGRFE